MATTALFSNSGSALSSMELKHIYKLSGGSYSSSTLFFKLTPPASCSGVDCGFSGSLRRSFGASAAAPASRSVCSFALRPFNVHSPAAAIEKINSHDEGEGGMNPKRQQRRRGWGARATARIYALIHGGICMTFVAAMSAIMIAQILMMRRPLNSYTVNYIGTESGNSWNHSGYAEEVAKLPRLESPKYGGIHNLRQKVLKGQAFGQVNESQLNFSGPATSPVGTWGHIFAAVYLAYLIYSKHNAK